MNANKNSKFWVFKKRKYSSFNSLFIRNYGDFLKIYFCENKVVYFII